MNTQDIARNVNDISLNQSAVVSQNRICEIWPVVKEGLELLITVIKNPIVKASIQVIITAGDAIIGKICNTPA